LGGVVCAKYVDVHAPGNGLGGALHEWFVGADTGSGHTIGRLFHEQNGLVLAREEDLQAVDPAEILYDLVEGNLKAGVICHIAPAQTKPRFSI
jgi:hypothetical protein